MWMVAELAIISKYRCINGELLPWLVPWLFLRGDIEEHRMQFGQFEQFDTVSCFAMYAA